MTVCTATRWRGGIRRTSRSSPAARSRTSVAVHGCDRAAEGHVKKLQGKVAIVTGASRGVGGYIAKGLAEEGGDIGVAARTEQAGESRLSGTIGETAAELRTLGVRAMAVKCDVTDEERIHGTGGRGREGGSAA